MNQNFLIIFQMFIDDFSDDFEKIGSYPGSVVLSWIIGLILDHWSMFMGFYVYGFLCLWISMFIGFLCLLDFCVYWISMFIGFLCLLDFYVYWISMFIGFLCLLAFYVYWNSMFTH